MDEIYGNLENYDEVNTITELRAENKELKQKIDEYATTMDKLQNDFDNLAAEFKKLEYNYSSLLKTARLEIERKTTIITNLNIEKDMMVLNSIQNGNHKNILNWRRNNRKSFNKTNKEDSDSNKAKPVINERQSQDDPKQKNDKTAREVDTNIPSEEVTSANTNAKSGLLNISNKVTENMDSCSDRYSESKENRIQNKHGPDESAKSRTPLTSRRKSVPSVNSEHAKFSSDKEVSPGIEAVKKDSPTMDQTDRKIEDRNYSDKPSSKILETAMKDKSSGYYESSRDLRKCRSSRYYDNDKYRSGDKSLQRYKRHYSPERLRYRKGPRSYQEDCYRHRVLESPPSDKFSKYQHRNRENRSDYDTSRSHGYEHERFRLRQQDRLPTKHKIPSDHDEPNNKRLKSDSYNRPNDDVIKWHSDKEFKAKQAIEPFEYLHDTSCQSPDYVHADVHSLHTIREIRHTAITELEDPRMASNKYNVTKTPDDKVVLCTVVGRNVDMKPIDKSLWGIKPVDVPDALVKQPLQVNEELVKEIYMDIEIENPISNLSMESGEICFDYDQVTGESYQKGSKHDNRQANFNSEKSLPSNFNKYKIPKLNQNGQDIIKNPPKPYDLNTNIKEKISTCHKTKSQIRLEGNHDNIVNKNVNKIQLEDINVKFQKEVSNREIVEGDLELSDDTSDCTEFNSQMRKKMTYPAVSDHRELTIETSIKNQINADGKEIKRKTAKKNKTSIKDAIKPLQQLTSYNSEPENQVKKTSNINQSDSHYHTVSSGNTEPSLLEYSKIESSKNPRIDQNTAIEKSFIEEKCKEQTTDDSKKSKGKKKPYKHKEALEVTNIPQVIDKKKSKKEKVTKPKEIKTKFNDLFGDSSSLITPEDLGLVTQGSCLPLEYVPIFEDAQDGIDLNKKTEVQIPPLKSENAISTGTDIISSDKKTEITPNTETNENVMESKSMSNINDEQASAPFEVLDASNVYSNLNSGASLKESDVVQTVIISSGVQPQCTSDKSVLQDTVNAIPKTLTKHVVNDQDKKYIRGTFQDTSHILLNALATSTPQKELQNSTDKISDSHNSNEVDSVIPPIEYPETNTCNSLNDTDVPDVRIVMKRRRKVIKKS